VGAEAATRLAAGQSSPRPGYFEPEVVDLYRRLFAPLVRRMWPADVHGLERLPDHPRYLVVANHSGMGIAELWSLLLFWCERFPEGRPVAGMAIPGAFHVPPVRYFLQGLGAVEATRAGARLAVESGVPLLVFPGGDHEATRPFWRARQVDFAGRQGWIRLAREHRLTIVPMAITGSHNTLPILAGGRAVSWLTGIRVLGVHRAPLPALALPAMAAVAAAARAMRLPWWAAASGAWAALWATIALPWLPGRIGFHFLPPVDPEAIAARSDDAVYAAVVGALQDVLADDAMPEGSAARG
jgi:1-acyl-sn-glycerol-3-phosphate acyltransferase